MTTCGSWLPGAGRIRCWRAGFDLKVFFAFVGKEPVEVTTTDVFDFITEQRTPRRGNVVRLVDGEVGLSARTIRRRVATLSGLFGYLLARGLVEKNPVPAGLPARQRGGQRHGAAGLPLLRSPRTLPRVLGPADAARLLRVLRTAHDRAMVEAMLLGGLRRCKFSACAWRT
jgi:integrase/recombinase XerD